ncbi:MAG TPA: hypothetical protein VHE35_24845 [Kofleriaceae bacterium]|nr:hypothetical protein [Kofleriaceae bacterium]
MRFAITSSIGGLLTAILACGCGSDDDFHVPPGQLDDGGHVDAPPVDGAIDGDVDAEVDAAIDAAIDAPIDAPATTDGIGPAITALNPLAGQMVAGTMTLRVNVLDPDGVDADSVIATIGGTDEITLLHDGTTTEWVGHYDTTALAGVVFPTIIVRAADKGGSESQFGFSIVLDNEGPLASLDPPRIREAALDPAGHLICSRSFDPVGGDAPSDGETVAQLVELRARVQDIGNAGTTTSTVLIPTAGIDDATVQLYVFDDADGALLVDSDGDGVCDEINPHIVPALVPVVSNEAAVVNLVPVTPSGTSFAPADMSMDPYVGLNLMACTAGTDTHVPSQLCVPADGVIRVPGTALGNLPMIYVPPPVTDDACLGFAFDAIADHIHDGWACAAVVSSDHLGNQRVSPVLRVCVDSDHNQDHGCGAPTSIAPPALRPACTGTLGAGGVVTAQPCTPPLNFATIAPPMPGDYELIRTDL